MREIVRGVVDGIWQYGDALGVPNLGGDVFFSPRFDENCLVNVVSLGLVRADRVVRSRVPEAASREPYVLILVGKPTDETGFGGASFASAVLEENAEGQRGHVQVPDPFLKRVLLEANRAVLEWLHHEKVAFGQPDEHPRARRLGPHLGDLGAHLGQQDARGVVAVADARREEPPLVGSFVIPLRLRRP